MGGDSPERTLRARYWDALRARRHVLPESVDLTVRRRERERAWRSWAAARLAEREQNDDIWRGLRLIRQQEAGADGYLAHRWRQLGRTHYTPDDLQRFHYALEEWVSPALLRIHEARRVALGQKTLRPWDVALESVLAVHGPAVGQEATLLTVVGKQPELRSMVRTVYELASAIERDQRTVLYERFLLRWAQAAMIDSFEAWEYTHSPDVTDPDACAERWRAGWLLYLPGIDWTGLDPELGCEWHDQWPVFVAPLHAIEPAIGQLAAVQLWASCNGDPVTTVAALAETVTTPSVHSALASRGLEFALDEQAVREALEALEEWA